MQNVARQLQLFEANLNEPGQAQGFSVRISARAKRLSIKVFPRGRVEVVVPGRTSARTVEHFVQENRAWIDRALLSLGANCAPESFKPPAEIDLPAIDLNVPVRYMPENGATNVRYRFVNGMVVLSGNTGDDQHCIKALRRWLSGMARRAFEPRLQALSLLTDVSYKKVHIRMQRTCWGSRSSSGTISLNLCLLFLEPELTRYLMVHELCHGRHMNHSKRFWKLVSRFEADYRQLDRQLGESWRAVPNWLGVY